MTQQFDPSRVRYVLFDLFETVVRFRDVVPYEERKAYGDHLAKFQRGEWSPFRPPETWSSLKAHQDAGDGLFRLWRDYDTAILSNCPAQLAQRIANNNNLQFDYIIQLAAARVFKPDPRAYQVAVDVLDCDPSECLMVTANKDFGDLEQARALGMQAALIRDPSSDIPDIIALAERLGC